MLDDWFCGTCFAFWWFLLFIGTLVCFFFFDCSCLIVIALCRRCFIVIVYGLMTLAWLCVGLTVGCWFLFWICCCVCFAGGCWL